MLNGMHMGNLILILKHAIAIPTAIATCSFYIEPQEQHRATIIENWRGHSTTQSICQQNDLPFPCTRKFFSLSYLYVSHCQVVKLMTNASHQLKFTPTCLSTARCWVQKIARQIANPSFPDPEDTGIDTDMPNVLENARSCDILIRLPPPICPLELIFNFPFWGRGFVRQTDGWGDMAGIRILLRISLSISDPLIST